MLTRRVGYFFGFKCALVFALHKRWGINFECVKHFMLYFQQMQGQQMQGQRNLPRRELGLRKLSWRRWVRALGWRAQVGTTLVAPKSFGLLAAGALTIFPQSFRKSSCLTKGALL